MVRDMDQPIACTLTADAFRDRTAELAELAGRVLLDRAPIRGGQRLTFAGDPATERDVRALVDAERSCCMFLEFDLRRRDDRLVLDVTGPDDARQLIAELFA